MGVARVGSNPTLFSIHFCCFPSVGFKNRFFFVPVLNLLSMSVMLSEISEGVRVGLVSVKDWFEE